MVTIGKAIRLYRESQRMNLRQLSDVSGLSRGYLSKLEAGKLTCAPSVSSIRRLASALKTSAYELELLAGHIPQMAYDSVLEFLMEGYSPLDVSTALMRYK